VRNWSTNEKEFSLLFLTAVSSSWTKMNIQKQPFRSTSVVC
jgi:hypothetical protein